MESIKSKLYLIVLINFNNFSPIFIEICRSFAYYTLNNRLPCTLRALIVTLQSENILSELIVSFFFSQLDFTNNILFEIEMF